MRTIPDLISLSESAFPMIEGFAAQIPGRCTILPPSENSGNALYEVQVTTRSPMGAIVYHTGGIIVDEWIRIIGSGSHRINRSLSGWNRDRSSDYLLIADDAVGGFFAIDGGALGQERGKVCYWAPDSPNWICLNGGYTDFIRWAMTADINKFYADLRWPNWRQETSLLSGDRCYAFYPFLWTNEGSISSSTRKEVPITEAFDLKKEILGI